MGAIVALVVQIVPPRLAALGAAMMRTSLGAPAVVAVLLRGRRGALAA